MIQTLLNSHQENQGMVTASRRKAVIQATREEEMMVVTMTPHHLLVVGMATETLTALLTPGTRAKTMTWSPTKSAVTEG